MVMEVTGPDISRSALVIVDMQNDFVHPDGRFAHRARENPERGWDMPFVMGTIPHVRRLADAFRDSERPVIHVATTHKPDYSDAQWPHWRSGLSGGNRTFLVESTWGAQIVDELEPRENEHLVVKKGYGGFSNTPLDTILRNLGVTTCVVAGVTTCVCVSTTVRGGVEHNYRMILVEDAVAELDRDLHAAEVKILGRAFADVTTTDGVTAMLVDAAMRNSRPQP
jgi:nicotinamidase-related amidase